MTSFSPREIVSELDRYIVGQRDAKRAVAIALRNRWRRMQLDEGLKEEVLPKNILMIGPTGVGKTEIARRLSRLARSPFSKIEASKFTEVGYVGRDVESMIRDLAEISVAMVRTCAISASWSWWNLTRSRGAGTNQNTARRMMPSSNEAAAKCRNP